MSFYRDQLEDWLSGQHIKADRVLDVGGRAKPVFTRVASWAVTDLYATMDNDLEPGDYATLSKQGANHWTDDINEPLSPDHPIFKVDKYDLVFCLEVMEYVWNPIQAIANIASLMKTGAKLVITFAFVYPVHKPIESDFLRYTPQGATKLLAECGLKTESVFSRIDRSGKLLEFYKADGMHVGGNAHVTGVIIEARKVGD